MGKSKTHAKRRAKKKRDHSNTNKWIKRRVAEYRANPDAPRTWGFKKDLKDGD